MLTKTKLFFSILLLALVSCQSTLEQSAQPAVTKTFTPIPVSTATFTATSTSIPEIAIFEEEISPNGEWTGMVTLTSSETSKDLLFKISNNHKNQIWIIEQVDVSKDDNQIREFIYPYIFKWSQDGEYLYYSHLPTFNDGCFGYFQPGGFDLIKFDLSTGEKIRLIEGRMTWMSLSPDETNLAYIDTFGGDVSILDIKSGAIKTYPKPSIKNDAQLSADTKDLYWSPDGTSLVYGYFLGACDLIYPISYIVQIFPETNQQIILVGNNEKGYYPIEWNVQDKILLEDWDHKKWWLNITTKEIISVNN